MGEWIPSGSTRVAAVIGDPIRHSLSPLILNTAFRELGLDWVYLAFAVPEGGALGALEAMRTLGIDGLSVTMPHKTAVADAVDELSPAADALRAVNCVVRSGRRLVGHNTDGPGFLAGLRADTGLDVAGRRCTVIGAGGAARAVILALAEAGAADIAVVNRTTAKAEQAAALAGPVGRVGTVDEVQAAELVVNATSVGMDVGPDSGSGAVPVDADLLGPGQVVADLVYQPLVTPFVAAARSRGITATNGVSMLVHQAGLALEQWTGETAPYGAMADAVRAAVERR